ncbi:MAG: hypothetical protein EBU82_12335 [Flavobacteriia bacterium]|nr:hypothetical protein [Flavobacteriia bacterium]
MDKGIIKTVPILFPRTLFFLRNFCEGESRPQEVSKGKWERQKLIPTFLPQKSSKKLGEGFKHGCSTPENRPFR